MDAQSTGKDLEKDLRKRLNECGAKLSRLNICARSTQNKYVRHLLSPPLFQEEQPENLIWFEHIFRTHVLPPRLPPTFHFSASACFTVNWQLSFTIILRQTVGIMAYPNPERPYVLGASETLQKNDIAYVLWLKSQH